MLGIEVPKRRGAREDGEKPFWISFSDLMTALMVLFLVAMAVALMAVTQGLQQIKKETEERDKTIESCVSDVATLTQLGEFKGVTVRGHSIDFGSLVQFQDKEHRFEKPGDERFVRQFIPRVLDVARSNKCDKWLKRVVVEGFASKTGDYLFNLNLSYQRSQRVLCALLSTQVPDALSARDRSLIQTLFLAGGSSFNTASSSAAQMRRVEIKLEFRDLASTKEAPPDIPLDPGLRCPNDR
ncbi:cell envelope biogenesis protein OmpA [Verminephrobacter aporrectodeae subsp. tuberculatae]|uniref:flagellar motor protein MotB n=1 Tax=Verminephrobacter aporrectodeae TaxID=1110389 RepID=UPI0022447290|nr:flagellar motor protein MotB [Verminephrobacter aporrectodeae]MCW8165625.1 cell envelope biogenesis protein OmpA [Verminephrobacter aporrectodeae subsp. tuberculatae]MCW8168392.1 cell envelope biogenesis protein OmpA [Verminephrobacter aporrectodeae subsp. tuberculatae]